MADEQVSDPEEPGDVLWALTDHLGTVRDLVRYDSEEVELVVHRAYDAFGNITDEVNPEAVDVVFGFTGRPFDKTTRLQNNLNRWFDAQVGRWVSEDPVGFLGEDANLYRYVNNEAHSWTDSDGLKPRPGTRPPRDWPHPGPKWKWDKGSGRFKKGGRYRHWDTTPGHRPHWDEENKDGSGHKNVYRNDPRIPVLLLGVGICVGTIIEDVMTGGAGVADDPATIGAGSGLIYAGLGFI